MGIPELNTPIFGTTKYPIAMGCKSNTEDEVLHTCQPFFIIGLRTDFLPCGLQRCECTCLLAEHQESYEVEQSTPTS